VDSLDTIKSERNTWGQERIFYSKDTIKYFAHTTLKACGIFLNKI